MICRNIEFLNFRNIEGEKIEFTPGVNVIHGENAQGKTNILEGIYLFARGKSFRAFKDKETIRFGTEGAIVKLEYEKKDTDGSLGVEIFKNGTKRFYKNKVKVNKTSEIIGDFRAVLFCPSHLGIIKDAPSVRRRFLDVAISQLRPIYLKMLSKYNNVLENRNTILKLEPGKRKQYEGMLEVYSDELSSLCADIAGMRIDYIRKLDYWVKVFFEEMTSGREVPKIQYECNARDGDFESRSTLKEKYFNLLRSNVDKEIKSGATLYGIHKDDLRIMLNGKDARFYCSQGQSRSLALAMKMAEGEISREYSGEYPVFLFDDVLSELDESRRSFIISKIENRQVIITSCEPIYFENMANYIEIKDGKRDLSDKNAGKDKEITAFENGETCESYSESSSKDTEEEELDDLDDKKEFEDSEEFGEAEFGDDIFEKVDGEEE